MYERPFEVDDLSETSEEEFAVSIFSHGSINSPLNQVDEIQNIVELVILLIGLLLNVLVLVTIIVRSSLHTCTGCYIISLIISNFVILLDILGNVIDRWFQIEFKPDLDFIGRVTLQASVCTITVFSVDRYAAFCCRQSSLHKTLIKVSTAAKGVVVIWSFASISTAMELHLYDQFRKKTVVNVDMFTTALYLIMTTGIIALLDIMILVQLRASEVVILKQEAKQLDSFQLLVGMTVGFYVTLVPDRITTILRHISSLFCCSMMTIHVFYYLAKFSSIIGPIIWIGTSKILRKGVQETLLGRWRS